MSKSKTDRNKQRVKRYKKVRNTSSWGSTIVYLLLIVLCFTGIVSVVVSPLSTLFLQLCRGILALFLF